MMIRVRLAFVLIVLVLLTALVAAQWTPPAGVPAPDFGVTETAPSPTLYVNAATGSDSNPGTIGSPRATIPRTLAAGTVVQVSGTQSFTYTSPNGFHSQGTIGSPVWIVSDPANAMVFSSTPEVDGTYLVVDGGGGKGWVIKDAPSNGPTNHITIRSSAHIGGGFGIAPFGTGVVSQIVLKGLSVHDYGTISSGEAGGDRHCVVIQRAHHVWVLDSLLYRCSGDGVQVNGGNNTTDGALTHHIYLARNVCSTNRQTCTWAKWSEDVVMTGNVALNMRSVEEPPPGSGVYPNPAAGFGGQYGASRLVIMANNVSASDYGIRIAGYDATTAGVTIIGNVIWNIHSTLFNPSPTNPLSGGTAIVFSDGTAGPRIVANNTISDVDAGIGSTPGGFAKNYFNNIFADVGRADIVWETDAPTLSFNQFKTTPVINPSTSTTSSLVGDPLFLNASGGNFALQVGSPALASGVPYNVDVTYLTTHGVSTGLDYSTAPNRGQSQLAAAAGVSQVTGVRGTVLPGTPPTISNLSVTTGQYGTAVTVTGTGFGATQGGSFVRFNGIAAPVSSWADTSILVAVPENSTTGSVVVIVAGAPSNAITFTIPAPTLSSLSISSGNVGDPVTLTGVNFGSTPGLSRVTFNGTLATVTAWSTTSLTTTVPSGATTGSVMVTVGGQASSGQTFTTGSVAMPIAASRLPAGNTSIPQSVWATAGREGGIPSRTTICSTLGTAGQVSTFSQSVTAAQINSAISGCGTDQVVLLRTGTYSLSARITIGRSNVVLRGEGGSSTRLVFSAAASGGCGLSSPGHTIAVCSGTGNIGVDNAQNTTTWTAGYTQGTSVITLAATTNLAVGSIIILDQLADTTGNGLTSGYPGSGDILHCDGGPPCSADGVGNWGRPERPHAELHKVTAINGLNVTIDPPVMSVDFRATGGCTGSGGTCTPGAWWGNKTGGSQNFIEQVGVEDLSIDWTAVGTNKTCLSFINASNSWARGVRCLRNTATGSFVMGVYMINAFRVTFQSGYIYGPVSDSGSNITNYSFAPHISSQILLENTIFHRNSDTINPNDADVGSVYAYNVTYDEWFGSRGDQHHNSGDDFNLYEGNNQGQTYCDDNHGSHHFQTYFRNHFDGASRNAEGGVSTTAAHALLVHCRFWNVLGGVTTGYTTYQTELVEGGTSVWELGQKGDCSNCASMPTDTNVKRTLFRWGNYDVVTGTGEAGSNDQTGVRWCGNSSNTGWSTTCGSTSEVPSAITNFPNSIPTVESLPPSLYLSAKPSWFGAVAYPPIGPDVSSGNISGTGGHANKIPARVCDESLTNDPVYPSSSPRILAFDRVSCYGT